MKKHKKKIIFAVVIVSILAFVFWYGGDAPGLRGWSPQPASDSVSVYDNSVVEQDVADEPTAIVDEAEEVDTAAESPIADDSDIETEIDSVPDSMDIDTDNDYDDSLNSQVVASEDTFSQDEADIAETIEENEAAPEPEVQDTDLPVSEADKSYSEANGMEIDEETGKDKYLTDPVPEGKPLPIEPQDAVISDKKYFCTLSVRCDTINSNISWLDKEKLELVPQDGVIFAEKTVSFYEGESVFNLLVREMKQNKIHLEFENTPIYNSAYIEGIANLYEFDCGELSGWMYRVNDWFPNYGCSRYALKPGDRVEWVYTCDLGADVGGKYAANGNSKPIE